jgi:hypothetical protein
VNMQGMATQDNEDMYFLLALKPSGMLAYVYEIGDDIRFRFHTLAEVGEPYQPVFRDMIKEKGWVVDYGVDLDYYPWMADFYRGLNP